MQQRVAQLELNLRTASLEAVENGQRDLYWALSVRGRSVQRQPSFTVPKTESPWVGLQERARRRGRTPGGLPVFLMLFRLQQLQRKQPPFFLSSRSFVKGLSLLL